MEHNIFPYGEQEIAYLRRRDAGMGEWIAQIGHIERTMMPDLFSALVYSIIGQQISSAAQSSVWARLCAQCGEVTPKNIAAMSADALRAVGMSGRKAGYLHGAANAALSGEIEFSTMDKLSDEVFCQTMTKLAGVGRWTAEMLLIFSLGRPDVLSYGDFGIRRGICRLYGLETIDRAAFADYRARYSPYGTIASFYLWEAARLL